MSIGLITMEDISAELSAFQDGGDLSFEIPSDKIADFIWFLQDLRIVIEPKELYELTKDYKININSFHSFRVLQTSWGIAIDISGSVKEIESIDHTIVVSASIGEDVKNEIIKGLKSVLSEAFFSTKKFAVEIKKIEYSLVDFQFDALYWASRDWLSQTLKVDFAKPKVSYNASSNKYLFSL